MIDKMSCLEYHVKCNPQDETGVLFTYCLQYVTRLLTPVNVYRLFDKSKKQ